jgi:hypothetical protein
LRDFRISAAPLAEAVESATLVLGGVGLDPVPDLTFLFTFESGTFAALER